MTDLPTDDWTDPADDRRVTRYDFGRLGKLTRTGSGAVRVPAYVTRVGIFSYSRADGTQIRELRPAEEVFAEDSLASLAGAPVTDLHPSEMVAPGNWRALAIGHVSETVDRADDKFVSAHLLIQDSAAIRAIDAGERRDISMGYSCRMDATPGTHEGQEYDAIQRDIRYNHAAIGPANWGRAGAEVSMRLDSNDNVLAPVAPAIQEIIMKTIRIDGQEYEVGSDAHLSKIEALADARVAGVQAKLDAVQAKLDEATGKLAGVQARLDEATDPAKIQAAVAARAELEKRARKVLGAEAKLDGLDARAVMIAAVEAADAALKLDAEQSTDYVRGLFAAVTAAPAGSPLARTRALAHESPAEAERYDAAKARAKFIEQSRDAWKSPLAYSKGN